jgi:N-acetylmuramoyl-L-alanine amidase
MKHFKYTLVTLFALTAIGTPWLVTVYPQTARTIDSVFSYIGTNYTSVFLRTPVITITQLKEKYEEVPETKKKIKVLVMPGHEPNFGGAEYGNLKERDMVVDLSGYLAEFLKSNSHYEVVVARDANGWNPDLESYFSSRWSEIIAFLNERKSETLNLIERGEHLKVKNDLIPNNARQDVALRLYGINKWSNENKVDIAIHVHFNDYPRTDHSVPGKYSGLSIYVPERQYANSTTTRAIADTIFNRLSKYNAVSNFPAEDEGIIEEQDLIAIGSYNTLDVPSMLIEYGYIYEPQFSDPLVRQSTLKDLAFQTYLGIQDFFGSGNDISLVYDTLMLPYVWKNEITKTDSDKNDVLALQSALLVEGVYPPGERSKNDCPRTGMFGPCTTTSLALFQKKYGITGEDNKVGEQTKNILNQRFSAQIR